jgi:hypothetical protein
LISCGTPSWLTALVKLHLHFYPLANLKTIPDLPSERIQSVFCSAVSPSHDLVHPLF